MAFPEAFLQRMNTLLGAEYPEFALALSQPRNHALRINPHKIQPENIPFAVEPVPWCGTGFYFSHNERPSTHPYYQAGAYYLQEASAQAVVEVLDPQPKQWVIDLCASPGGKSTHIASKMAGEGLLIANEYTSSRVGKLLHNLKMWGAQTTVLNSDIAHIAQKWQGLFDRVLLDAPCSGEGMFRKNPEAAASWTPQHVERLAHLQSQLLRDAAKLLAPEGVLVYSTCTFSPEENEAVIESFLKHHPEFALHSARLHSSFSSGFGLPEAARLFPHKLRGEGHFIAKLCKTDGEEGDVSYEEHPKPSRESQKAWQEFCRAAGIAELSGVLTERSGHLYLSREYVPTLRGLKVPYNGVYLGMVAYGQFSPARALALHLRQAERILNFSPQDELLEQVISGESVASTVSDGWYWLAVDGMGFDFGYAKKGKLKTRSV